MDGTVESVICTVGEGGVLSPVAILHEGDDRYVEASGIVLPDVVLGDDAPQLVEIVRDETGSWVESDWFPIEASLVDAGSIDEIRRRIALGDGVDLRFLNRGMVLGTMGFAILFDPGSVPFSGLEAKRVVATSVKVEPDCTLPFIGPDGRRRLLLAYRGDPPLLGEVRVLDVRLFVAQYADYVATKGHGKGRHGPKSQAQAVLRVVDDAFSDRSRKMFLPMFCRQLGISTADLDESEMSEVRAALQEFASSEHQAIDSFVREVLKDDPGFRARCEDRVLGDVRRERDRLQSSCSKARSDLESLESRVGAAEVDLDAKNGEVRDLESRVAEAKDRLTEAEARLAELQSEEHETLARLDGLRSEMIEVRASAAAAASVRDAAAKAIAESLAARGDGDPVCRNPSGFHPLPLPPAPVAKGTLPLVLAVERNLAALGVAPIDGGAKLAELSAVICSALCCADAVAVDFSIAAEVADALSEALCGAPAGRYSLEAGCADVGSLAQATAAAGSRVVLLEGAVESVNETVVFSRALSDSGVFVVFPYGPGANISLLAPEVWTRTLFIWSPEFSRVNSRKPACWKSDGVSVRPRWDDPNSLEIATESQAPRPALPLLSSALSFLMGCESEDGELAVEVPEAWLAPHAMLCRYSPSRTLEAIESAANWCGSRETVLEFAERVGYGA